MDIAAINYTTQALGRMAQQYVGKPNLTARLTLFASTVQDLDSCVRAMADRLNVGTAVGAWLDICGWLVGIARVLPNGDVLTDEPYRSLILARIARNHCTGDVPSMVAQLKRLFDPLNEGTSITVTDLGRMSMLAEVGRLLTAAEKSILSITSGISQIPGGILPKPSGVQLMVSNRATTDFFCFSDISDPGVPLITGGMGFSDISSPTGSWAGVVI